MSLKKLFFVVAIYFLVFNLIGCEAFVRKFTRKKDKEPQEEMVLAPEPYKNTASKEDMYRQSFVYWKAEHEELISALLENKPAKKRIKSAQEAIKHLENMKVLLSVDKQKQLGGYIIKLQDLLDNIKGDSYGSNNNLYRMKAENIRRDILRDFTYDKVKNSLL
jgi:hypothetical protein